MATLILRMLFLAVLLGFVPCAPSAVAAETRQYDFSSVGAELDLACTAGTFSGVVVVRAHGKDVFERTCGQADIVNNISMSRQTRFKVYSVSKFITALAVMKLVEDGKMSLQTPIQHYLPEVPDEWRLVTIRQLLNHTSGIADLTEALLFRFRSDHATAMRGLLVHLTPEQMALQSPPGKTFHYNNYGYELLVRAAASAAGQTVNDMMSSLVFKPAGMSTASIEQPKLLAGHALSVNEQGLAIGYNGKPGKLEQADNWAFIQQGAGAVRASADDFIALDTALKAGQVVSLATLRKMISDPADGRSAAEGSAYKLGIVTREIDGVRQQGHTGGNNGYITDFEQFPDDDAVLIAMSNRGFTETESLVEAVAKTLKRARSEK